MDNIFFNNSFGFVRYCSKRKKHTDNSDGIYHNFIAYIKRGTAKIVTDSGTVIELMPGDLLFLPLGLRYESYWYPEEVEDGESEWYSFRFLFFPCQNGKRYSAQKIEVTQEEKDCIERLCSDLSVSASSVGLLYCLLGQVLPRMEESEFDKREVLLEKAKQYIVWHRDVSVPELARYCHMSESALYAFFKSYANMTPIEMKNAIHIENAVNLLVSTDLSIEMISEHMGFKSTAYFRKIVKERTNKTPSQLRRERHLKNNP